MQPAEEEILDLPLILNNCNKRDIQGSEIVISPKTEAELPNPVQPSILYMEASLPSQLQSLTISKVLDYSPDPRLKQLLPLPLPVRQASISSSLTSSPMLSTTTAYSVDDDESAEEEEEEEGPISHHDSRKRSYTFIPLHLNPVDQQDSENSNKKMMIAAAAAADTTTEHIFPSSPSFSSSSPKQYHCTFCQKKFLRPSSLKIHTYSHTGEKPFNCSFPGCRRRFSVQSNMRRHLRVHSN